MFWICCTSFCTVCTCVCCFFFKQKTAYEMRISDWSSDVCSSDLPVAGATEAADHLVGDQQDAVLAADPLDLGKIARRRHDHPAGALDRLGDEGGDPLRPDLADPLLPGLGERKSVG